ncbi:MAG TPA: P1 family peptidase [Longimicrobiales bacterium]
MPPLRVAASLRDRIPSKLVPLVLLACTSPLMSQTTSSERPRAREAGVVVGILPTGPLNAITDVAGVRVGQVTVTEGDSVRTGVTAILPHGGNVFRERVPAAIHVGNGFGKLLGVTQVRELGELETPILLTCTLCVWKAADAMVEWLLHQPGMDDVRSINPVVGETNDGFLNDIRVRPIRPEHVVRALESASGGPVVEGAVGAGAGTVAFGWKGGIGTSSRRLPERLGGYTVGVLVQTNFGGVLTINGAPVGRELGRYAFGAALERRQTGAGAGAAAGGRTGRAKGDPVATGTGALDRDASGFSADGSIMIVVATDAPLDARKLDRLAVRALGGLARTGASMTNGSGDYVIAFSTAESVRRPGSREPRAIRDLPNDLMSPLFQAAAEATEEAIYNSLFKATTVSGHRGTVEALPLDRTLDILEKYGVLHWDRTLPPEGGER